LSFKRRDHDRYLPEFKRERYEKASKHVRFDQPATKKKKNQLTIFLMTENSSSALLASRTAVRIQNATEFGLITTATTEREEEEEETVTQHYYNNDCCFLRACYVSEVYFCKERERDRERERNK
jgi:hypothetical protein